ncbi:6-hydroxymethylpterin diphosphokinase MptE-like protein [Neptuniibacter sp. QD48_55]|uniref:motility associated factor glycosyltransferase family protein n=1 Tax=Neptuniibacter sp. QD48_55 TaxID=3398212 RepID=UPI0039F4EAC1
MDHLEYVDYKLNALKTNILMEQAYVANMLMLKGAHPDLYLKMVKYEPEKMKLGYGSDKILNLYDVNSNQALYPGDPEQICKKQVSDFINNIEPLTLSSEGKVSGEEGVYSRCVKKIYAAQADLGARNYKLDEGELPFVMMLGGGLGLQLQYLLNAKDVKRLMYYEPNLDAFHASLHIVDWTQIKNYFDRQGYDLVLKVGASDKTFLYELTEYARSIGTYNLLYASVYSHYNSPETLELARQIKRNFAKAFIGLGYYDDERVGLNHSISNLEKGIPTALAFNSYNKYLKETPVFVIGNGPSLDLVGDFLRENRSKVVIISCGTSLSTLYQKGIKPDIHVEQERVAFQATICEKYTDKSFREGVRLIALNPVYSDVFDLFDSSYMMLKPNDIGADLISKVVNSRRDYYLAYNCNPTVTNTAVSLSILLGAENVYLAGIDCGYRDPSKHHATGSFYEQVTKEGKVAIDESFKKKGSIVREGNFGGKVLSTYIFDSTRANIEEAIRAAKDVNFFNLSDGVLITGATPLPIADLSLDAHLANKEDGLDKFFKAQFEQVESDSKQVRKSVKEAMENGCVLLDAIKSIFQKEVSSREDIVTNLNLVNKFIFSQYKQNILMWHLLSGSFESIGVLINMGCYARREHEMLRYYKVSTEAIIELIDEVKVEISEDPYAENVTEKDENYLKRINIL